MKNFYKLSVIAVFAVLTGCSTTETRAPIEHRTGPDMSSSSTGTTPVAAPTITGETYTVQQGDTLMQVSRMSGQKLSDLIEWNKLEDPGALSPGQVLRIQPPEEKPAGSGSGDVEVRPLDNKDAAAGAAVGTAAAGTAATVSTPNKTSPQVEKQPYSDQKLAEMQGKKTDADKADTGKKTSASATSSKDGITWQWPTEGKVVSGFAATGKGIDISGTAGQKIYAAAAGRVTYAQALKGYGNLVIVKHSEKLLSAYAHNKRILVKEGDKVSRGQAIAEMGNSDSSNVKLHFQIRQQGGKPIDPLQYLPAQ